MANIKSQKKRIKTNHKAYLRNKNIRSELKSRVKNVRLAVQSNDKEASLKVLAVAIKKIDKAHSKGLIHKNKAANQKSALTKLVNNL